jgi:hypothetical protein
MPDGMGKAAGDALEVGKDPIAALLPQPVQGRPEKPIVIHELFLSRAPQRELF